MKSARLKSNAQVLYVLNTRNSALFTKQTKSESFRQVTCKGDQNPLN